MEVIIIIFIIIEVVDNNNDNGKDNIDIDTTANNDNK